MFQKEQAIGLFFSIALHVVLVVVVFLSVNPEPITPPKGISIQAEIMNLDDFMKNKPKTETKKPKPVEKKPKPKPVEKKPEPKPKPKPVEKKPEPKPKPKPVIKPKVDEKKRQEKTERQKRLEEIRRKRQELEDSTAEPVVNEKTPEEEVEPETQPAGSTQGSNQENTMLTQYIASIQSAVTRQWARPASTPKGLTCRIKVSQIPGGGVIDVSIGSPCNASTVVKNSIINAVKKADPLPYRGFETVFDRRLHFTFQYQGD